MARAVDELDLTAYEQLQVLLGTLAGDKDPDIAANLKKIQAAIANIKQDRFPFLEHPGKIHYLFPSYGESTIYS